MNLLNEETVDKKKNQNKKTVNIIIISIALVICVIIGILAYMAYLEDSELKLILNNQQNAEVKNLLVFESDGTIYVPIRAISSHLGYKSYNGEYTDRSEDNSRCYVECNEEVANFTLNSDKIYKLNLEKNTSNYTYIYMDKPVKAINGELYITTDGMKKAFNTTFEYNQDTNTITIYTTPYLIEAYSNMIMDKGYTGFSENFENEKAVVQNMLVVTDDTYYGVISAIDGSEILECKYDDIIYQEVTNDFIVCSNSKYGIIGTDRKTKININYDNIELMDYDAGLYVVKRNNKYGVIDLNGNSVIYVENDRIGIDITRFEENDLTTGYILVGNLIPVQRNSKWGLFDTKGNQLVEFEYDSFGYIANSDKEALNLLVIPGYNVIVGCIDNKYTLLNTSGEQPIRAFVDDIYMIIENGEKHYYMTANDKTYDVEAYLDELGVTSVTDTEENTDDTEDSEEDTTEDTSTDMTNTTDDSSTDEPPMDATDDTEYEEEFIEEEFTEEDFAEEEEFIEEEFTEEDFAEEGFTE